MTTWVAKLVRAREGLTEAEVEDRALELLGGSDPGAPTGRLRSRPVGLRTCPIG
jgi:hypothetical protein